MKIGVSRNLEYYISVFDDQIDTYVSLQGETLVRFCAVPSRGIFIDWYGLPSWRVSQLIIPCKLNLFHERNDHGGTKQKGRVYLCCFLSLVVFISFRDVHHRQVQEPKTDSPRIT